MNEVEVHIWSDIACPWCFLGLLRLEQGAHDAGVALRLLFRSYELDRTPLRPDDERSYLTRLAQKLQVTETRAHQMVTQMKQLGAEEGISFDFSRIVPANTFDAHRLLHLARARSPELQPVLKRALLEAHFSHGVDVGQKEALVQLAGDVGLDRADARSVLDGSEFAAAVRQDEEEARTLRISGVPFFLIEGEGVGGAQQPSTFSRLFKQLTRERELTTTRETEPTPPE